MKLDTTKATVQRLA